MGERVEASPMPPAPPRSPDQVDHAAAADAPPLPRGVGDSLALWVVLARAARSLQEVAAVHAARHGLTLAEFGALEALYHKGPLLVGDLQQRILVSSGGATYLVDRLQERGLVERRENPDDRRARFAVLTPAGEALMRAIFPEHARLLHEALQGVNAAERRELRELLKRVGLYAESYAAKVRHAGEGRGAADG